jgi:amidase
MVPMAHGSDGGGSLRVPASCCGLFGLKPTRGRTPSGPDVGRVWQGLVTEHALTRSVRDSAALLDVTLGDDVGTPLPLSRPSESYLETMQRDPGKLRIAVIKEPYFQTVLDSDCVIAVDNSAQLCTELGHHVDESKLPIDTEELLEAFAVLMCAETSVAVEYFKEVMKRKPRSNELEFTTKMLARLGKHYTAEEFSWAMSVFDKVTRQVGKFHQDYDVILTPTLAKPPIKNKTFNPYQYQKSILNLFACLPTDRLFKSALVELIAKGFQFNPYNVLFNISGQPAMSVPLYWNRQNLPIGSQFAARFGDEKTLFQLARQLEKLRPWQHRIPAKVK